MKLLVLTALGMFAVLPALAVQPGADAPDLYYPQWLAEAAHAPVFKVRDAFLKEIATALHGRYEITHPTIQIDFSRMDHGCVAPKLD